MDRRATDFLTGFGRAALLARRLAEDPPAWTTATDYLLDVADLHAGSDDYCSRGLASGCRAALGRA